MQRALILGLTLLMAGVAGCGTPVAVIKAHQAEIEFLNQDEAAVGQKYADRRAVLEASIADLWAACAKDITDYEPTADPDKPDVKPKPLDVYAVECITGVRAAEGVLQTQILALVAAEVQERQNFEDRRRLLRRATEIVEESQKWPKDALLYARELKALLEEK